ncbi:MAG: non-canonical purine NTP pyrophosphatase [Myxococcales bacterium FL481]|nr:MAG: non-canonical purine NTP pyrophosphatase [Myxococcales bacterium FL481]
MDPLILASTNRHKVVELERMVAGSMPVRTMAEFGEPPTIHETGSSFIDNAVLKAEGIAAWLRQRGERGFVLADDSGICIDALDGRPGVYSARFAGLHADDAGNNAHMVAQLRAIGCEQSLAHYVCVLALTHTINPVVVTATDADEVQVRGTTLCVTGRCDGEVRTTARGDGGFGYDPHFWIDARTRTFAELAPAAKAARSHRGEALRRLFAVWRR